MPFLWLLGVRPEFLLSWMWHGSYGLAEHWDRRLGDWDCSVCGDMQFARNMECRRYGEPCSRDGGGHPALWDPRWTPAQSQASSEFELYGGGYDLDAYLDGLSGDMAEVERARLCPEY